MTAPDESPRTVLLQLLAEHGLAADTRLYREAIRSALEPTRAPGIYRLPANPAPSESVIDVYGNGHLVQAEQVGAGLAFAESSRPNWQETMEMRVLRVNQQSEGQSPMDRVEVEAVVIDILRQGGLLYPVESVTVERVWYCTLPAGSVDVREVK